MQLRVGRHRAVPVRRVRRRQPRQAEALRRLQARTTKYEERTGFGGYKVACLDTVTFRIVTEPGARVAGLEDRRAPRASRIVPTKSQDDAQEGQEHHARAAAELLGPDRDAEHLRRRRPTICRCARRSRRRSTWTRSWRRRRTAPTGSTSASSIPSQPIYTEAGKETYNQKDTAQGEEVPERGRLQGRADRAAHQQGLHQHVQRRAGDAGAAQGDRHQRGAEGGRLADLGADAAEQERAGWNFFFTGWGTQPALGALATDAVLRAAQRQRLHAEGRQATIPT